MKPGNATSVQWKRPSWPDDYSDKKELLRASLVEFVTTSTFVFFGTLSVVATGTWLGMGPNINDVARIVPISLTFGLSIAVLVYASAHISGGHINPAVTLMFVALQKMSWIRACAYWVAQFLGAMVGSAFVWAATSGLSVDDPNDAISPGRPPFKLGANELSSVITAGNGFVLEFMGTFLLCLVVVQTAVDTRSPAKNMAPLSIGLAVAIAHLCLVPFTGCGINPARTFGPAMIDAMAGVKTFNGSWWIYWVGPIAGSLVAAFVTTFLFQGPSSGVVEVEASPETAEQAQELVADDEDEEKKNEPVETV